ncbi:MAG TPA: hypothetical protein VE685_07035 [Thermoanaerobaculia bacterium]|nr:hypothetical protein [Thermoanaerobaculia bacterium]
MPDWTPVDLLPGLWVGFLGAFLASALGRWYDRVPGRMFAVFGLVLVILFGEVLFGGKLLLPLDTLRGQVPFQQLPPMEPHGNVLQGDLVELVGPSIAAVREAYGEGRWPLWNHRVGTGMPLLADPQAQALQPLVLLGYPFPWVRAAAVTAALRVFLTLTFSFLLFRRQGLGEGPALAGALAFGLGGFVILWVGWPIASAAVFLPLILYAVTRCDEEGGWRDVLLLGFGVLGLLLGGHPQTTVYVLLLSLAFLLDRARQRAPGTRARLLRQTGLAFALAGMLAAPLLLPFLELLPETLRAVRMREPRSPAPPGTALRWLQIAAPNAFGNSRFIDYWGLESSNEDATGFVGTATLLAALLAVGARRRFPQEGMVLGIAVVCLALLLAGLPSGAALLSRRLLLLVGFCLAYLGACTLERFRRGGARWWPVLAVATGLAAVIAWGYLGHPHPEDANRLAPLRLGWLHWQGRFLVLTTVLLLAAGTLRRRLKGMAVGIIPFLVAAELILAHGPANPPMPRRLAFPVNGPIRFLQEKLEAGYGSGAGHRLVALRRAFPPNLASLYGLTDVRLYNPMAPRGHVEFMAPVTVRWEGESPQFGNLRDPIYRRLGVKYVLSAPGTLLRPPLQRVFTSPEGWIWERPRPLPRVFLPGRAPRSRLIISRLEAQWITVLIASAPGGPLRSSVYQDGGWKVLVNQQPFPAEREDGPFLAARVPAGDVQVELLYRPPAFLIGLLVAGVGLAAGVAALVPPPTSPAGPTPPGGPE